jgi:uncharacterized membrane protein (DUF4010 family)
MVELEILLRLLLAIGIGALIGTEREKFAKKRDKLVFGGIRTYSLISLLGAISGIFILEKNVYVLILSFSALAIILSISYYCSTNLTKGKEIGLTGEVAALLVFFNGFMVFSSHILLSVAIAILIASLLYLKERIHSLLKKISEKEVYATLVFAVIAFVMLPFLPNKTYGPFGVFNPYKIWLMIVLICGIGYVGYFLIRLFGSRKGIGLAAVLGGLVSSTAVTMTMAQRSKEGKNTASPNMLVFGTIIANTVMFVRVAVAVFIVNSVLLKELLPALAAMAFVGFVSAGIIWFSSNKADSEAKVEHKSPFSMTHALKFGAFFAIVLFLLKAAQIYFGNTGTYIASLLSGFIDVDAVTLSMATIAGTGISESVAATAIILAVMSNTIIKLGYSFVFGSKEFSKKVGIVMGIMVSLGLAIVFLV